MAPAIGAGGEFRKCSLLAWMVAFLLGFSLFVQLSGVLGLSTDGHVLLQLKSSVQDEYGALQSWNSSDLLPCAWNGVTCDPSSQQVIGVDLFNANLSGLVPAMVCQLPKLTTLVLSWNYFNGSIPSALLSCELLEVLDLSYNLIVSPLPEGMNRLRSLKILDLSFNNFSGPIPVSFGDLPALESLNLSANLLSESIPAELGNLSSLVELVLDVNDFSGVLPAELGNLTHLERLTSAYGGLSGPIPASLGNTNLSVLFLDRNSFSGPIPSELGKLTRLKSLDLSQNSLTGGIPLELMDRTELTDLLLWQNNLTGEIPWQVENLTSLVQFDVSMNALTGTIPEGLSQIQSLAVMQAFMNQLTGGIPPGFGTLPKLYCFKLFTNHLTGVVPPSLGQFSPLEKLDLSTNSLTGSMPVSLCAGGSLTDLILFQNNISGSLPEGLGNCPTLERVRLEGNLLTGSVPVGLWGSPNIQNLYLSDNFLNGSIGSVIGSAKALEALHIDNNQFTGLLPLGIGSIPNLTDFLASMNRLEGTLPNELGQLQWLSTLELGVNSFNGTIPVALSQCLRLDKLNLSSNLLVGDIPPQMGDFPSLNTLDLSYNELSGPVPPELGKLQLTEYNFSYNNLSGVLPPPFNLSFLPSSFLGNPGLYTCTDDDDEGSCGGIPQTGIHHDSGSSNHSSVAWAVGATVAAIAVILFFAACCFWKRYQIQFYYWKNRRNDQDLTWSLRSFQKVGFIQEEVMESLHESCLIGSGGSGKVYKAELSNGQVVAVKKLEARQDNGFSAEVETLGKIRHRNIVKLLCCCSNFESNVLVYEYMPNGSLGDYLHNDAKGSLVLSWDTRYKIAVGAAEGLAYLHHDCVPPIVHRDVKSNNILLDVDFEAHLGDFGLAKIFQAQSMSAVAGSYGYIAPEYGYTLKVTEKSDIYSFGVVLLELVSGKKPIELEFGDLDIVKWATKKIETKAGAMEVLDPEIRASAQERMMLVLKVGLLCTSFLPANRPSMRNVVQMLLDASSRHQPHHNQPPRERSRVRVEPQVFSSVEKS